MKRITITAALFFAAITTHQIFAQATPAVRARQVHQQERIHQGEKSGELTHREAGKLEREQAEVKGEKKAAKADGVVTPAERQTIRHDQNKASKDIYRDKHNARVRP